jgi:hypothetical protein
VGNAHPVTVNIIKTFPAGWKNLPQELVDEILAYLKDDLSSLTSCSKSCKALFCSTRPLIYRTFCLTRYTAGTYRSGSLNRGGFDALRLAERAQVLQYATRLDICLGNKFVPKNLQPHLRYFHAMRGITSLTIYRLDVARFLPALDKWFGHIMPTLRSLTLIGARTSTEDIFHLVFRFPLLQDLHLEEFLQADCRPPQPYIPPELTISPPLNGTLRFWGTYSSDNFIRSLASAPGGIHFRSVEVGDVGMISFQALIDACSKTIETITFTTRFRESLRFCAISYTRTYPVRKREVYRTSESVMFSKNSRSPSQTELLRTTSSKFTCPESFHALYLHPSLASSCGLVG